MTLTEFEDCIGRYGTAIETWPETVRPAALALLAATPQAGRVLDQAHRLDRLFAVGTILRRPRSPPFSRAQPRRGRLSLSRILDALGPDIGAFSWLQAGGLAACLLLGVIIGSFMTPQGEDISLALLDFGVGAQSGLGAHLDSADE